LAPTGVSGSYQKIEVGIGTRASLKGCRSVLGNDRLVLFPELELVLGQAFNLERYSAYAINDLLKENL
jgi:hypothetical protein